MQEFRAIKFAEDPHYYRIVGESHCAKDFSSAQT